MCFAFDTLKDVVMIRSGQYREYDEDSPIHYEVKTCLNPDGRYFSYARVNGRHFVTEDFATAQEAESAGISAASKMIEEACYAAQNGL
jgi:hypothetical protein